MAENGTSSKARPNTRKSDRQQRGFSVRPCTTRPKTDAWKHVT